jgi:dipeptidyl-peptidase 4
MSRLLFAVLSLFGCGFYASAAKQPVTIDAVMRNGNGGHHGGADVTWTPDGNGFVSNHNGALSFYNVLSGQTREIVKLEKLESAAQAPESSTSFDWTNRRVGESEVQWFSDGNRLLVSASGDLFVVDTRLGAFEPLTHTAEYERDPKLSPDNSRVSFRRGPDLYVLEIASRKIVRLTNTGSDTLLNGQLDWVYPEELDLTTAHWWSPDSKHIAYLQFDIGHEPIFPQVSLLKQHGILEPERYPKAGDPNAEVRLGVVPATGGETRWMNLGEPRDFLLARVTWLPSSQEVAAERLPRVQNKLDLLIANIESGAARLVLHEEDPYWINVKDEPYFLRQGHEFLWSSERDGFRHLYLYSEQGKLEKQLTSGEWEVDSVDVDQEHGRVFFTSSEASPLERQLYVMSLDGGSKRRLTEGPGTHSISMSPNASYFLDTYSSVSAPPGTTLRKTDGSQLRVYREPDRSELNEFEILPAEFVGVKASDGTTLYARLIKPAGFEPSKKYPAIVMVYGGPGAQQVRNSWGGLSWDQVLAHKGFVIWQLDNRGSTGRGHKFESAIFRNLGFHELEDQQEGIKWLIGQGFVDPQRIGMYGWSYGGFMTLYTVTNAPELIKAAVAGAPVSSWRNYDSIYTERYMGLPSDQEEAYRATSPQTKAGQLQAKLLIVHNVEDDNVHFANTVQMADALEKANKQFFMLLYPQHSHSVGGPVRRHLLEETTSFFEHNLK